MWEAIAPALLIAVLRAGDVTLNVFKTVAVVQGRRVAAPLLQAAESGLWLAAAGIVFANMTPARAVGFVVGVLAGTVIGMEVVNRLQLGMVTVRVYRQGDDPQPTPWSGGSADTAALAPGSDGRADASATTAVLDRHRSIARELHRAGFPATTFDGIGRDGPVEMTLSTVRRRAASDVMELARRVDPTAFISIDNDLYPPNMSSTPGVRG